MRRWLAVLLAAVAVMAAEPARPARAQWGGGAHVAAVVSLDPVDVARFVARGAKRARHALASV